MSVTISRSKLNTSSRELAGDMTKMLLFIKFIDVDKMTYHATRRRMDVKKLSSVKIISVVHELVPKIKKFVD